MSEQKQQQAPTRKHVLHDLTAILRYWVKFIRTRQNPTAFDQVVENLAQESGVPSHDIPTLHNMFVALRDAAREKESAVVDLYLVSGIGVIDLILLQVLLSAGASDAPLSVALHFLIWSLPLTAMSLFFRFLKQQYAIPTYGKIHSSLSFLALVTGTAALDGAIWHVSRIDGIMFLCLATVLYGWATCYLILIRAARHFNAHQKPPEAGKSDAPDPPPV